MPNNENERNVDDMNTTAVKELTRDSSPEYNQTELAAPVPIKPAAQSPSPLVRILSEKYKLAPAVFINAIVQVCWPKGTTNKPVDPPTPAQLAAFLTVAHEYNLNPMLKEIMAFPKDDTIQVMVPIDGWYKLAGQHPQFDGVEFVDEHDKDGTLIAITCKMYRKDRQRTTEITEYMDECRKSTPAWDKWPARMLRHKAYIQCGRMTFGFSGFVDPDEAERINEAETTEALVAAENNGIKRKSESRDEALKEKLRAQMGTQGTSADAMEEARRAQAVLEEQRKQVPHEPEGLKPIADIKSEPCMSPNLNFE